MPSPRPLKEWSLRQTRGDSVAGAGSLGQGGTVWNGFLLTNAGSQSQFDLVDEFGAATVVDVVIPDRNGRFNNQPVANDLQSDGLSGGFSEPSIVQIRELTLGATYGLGLYVGGSGVGFEVTDGSGTMTSPASTAPTGILPGISGADFHLFEDLVAYHLGNGHVGLEITVPAAPFGGQFRQLAGFQVQGAFVPEPTTALLLASGLTSLAMSRRRLH